jgi:pimeloyl-ACP methyl ester carboxylesterase
MVFVVWCRTSLPAILLPVHAARDRNGTACHNRPVRLVRHVKATKVSGAMRGPELVKFEIEGAEIAVRLAGDRERPALLLMHGLPNSSEYFRNVIGPLSRDCFVIAPDLPGFGGSEPVSEPSFSRFADMIDVLLSRLGTESFHLYVHDFGANVALHLATRAPRRIRSLIIQNANAHESGMGPQWMPVRAYWADPTPEREAVATEFLTKAHRSPAVGGGLADHVAPRPARDAPCARA